MEIDEYEAALRGLLQQAEAEQRSAMERVNASDDHPMSQAYKTTQWGALIAGGRVVGLTEALNLLTGRDDKPQVVQPEV